MTDHSSLRQWTTRPAPGNAILHGRTAIVEPFAPGHLEGLYAATAGPSNDDIWRYMPAGPFHSMGPFEQIMEEMNGPLGWRTVVIRAAETGTVIGMASFLRIRPEHGSCEIGMVAHGPAMRRSVASTEAHYLLARHVFEDLGYRRYEWKCNAANEASMTAAKRYGFTYEGTFRQDMVVKGENRDTAWWSMLDSEWPAKKARFESWLDPANFDADGRQRKRLEEGA